MRALLRLTVVLGCLAPLSLAQMRGAHFGGAVHAGSTGFHGGVRFSSPNYHFYFYGNRYPWFGAYRRPYFWPYYYPYPAFYGTYGYASSPVVIQAQPAAEYNPELYTAQRELAGEVDRLNDEVDRLKAEREQLQVLSRPPARIEPSTVLVFRDKHIQEVQNYAIVGQTLWIMSQDRANKVPLSQLDIPATQKLNDERGVAFQLPR
jgi:hypothetical protein